MMREVEGSKSAADLSFGFECAGIIKRVGQKVSGFKVGDAVIAAMTRESLV
jgi:NADPH:quinone reductase-like Zn-dependent oxidoreductase